MKTRILKALLCISAALVLIMSLVSCEKITLFGDDKKEPDKKHTCTYVTESQKAATCTAAGYKNSVCKVCGNVRNEKINPKGHAFNEWQTVAVASCTAEGSEKRECANCPEIEIRTIQKTSHDYVEKIVTQPDCIKDGYKTYSCKNCTDNGGKIILATGHKLDGNTAVVKDSTCTERGSGTISCTKCKAKIEIVVEPKGHTFVIDDSDFTINADDSVNVIATCAVCDYNKSRIVEKVTDYEIDIKGIPCSTEGAVITYYLPVFQGVAIYSVDDVKDYHFIDGILIDPNKTYYTNDRFVKIKDDNDFSGFEITCTKSNSTICVDPCDHCGKIVNVTAIDPHTVDVKKSENFTAATCTVPSSGNPYCTVCEAIIYGYTEPAYGHMYSITGEVTESGSVLSVPVHCSICDSDAVEVVNAYESKLVTEATCTSGVVKNCTFVIGSQKFVANATGAKSNHKLNDEIEIENGKYYTLNDELKTYIKEFANERANCTEDGKAYYICNDCGESQLILISAYGHTYDKTEMIMLGCSYTDPTCEESGSGQGWCSVCKSLCEYNPAPLGHTYEIEKNSETETTFDLKLGCKECDFAVASHVVEKKLLSGLTVKPTCISEGSKTYWFEYRGEAIHYVEEIERELHYIINSTGNKVMMDPDRIYDADAYKAYISEFSNSVSTCSKNGLGHYRCASCNTLQLVNTKRLHKIEGESTVKEAPSCYEEGTYNGYCTVCKDNVDYAVDMLAHDFKYEITVYPDLMEETKGEAEVHCANDGCTAGGTVILPEINKNELYNYDKTEVKISVCGATVIRYTYAHQVYGDIVLDYPGAENKHSGTDTVIYTWILSDGEGNEVTYKGYICSKCGKMVVITK